MLHVSGQVQYQGKAGFSNQASAGRCMSGFLKLILCVCVVCVCLCVCVCACVCVCMHAHVS